MSKYTFAELLNIFFHLRQDPEAKKTQNDLAREIGIAVRTINHWFQGTYLPRNPTHVERLARGLGLSCFQADMMLYSINPEWVRYGTPPEVLGAAEVVRYREEDIPYQTNGEQLVPSIAQIENDWSLVFADKFESNHQHWGIGHKNDGTGAIQRCMSDGRYILSLKSHFHGGVFMGGDSHCFAPDVYYFSVYAQLIERATDNDGYLAIFEELSDGCHAIFRVREPQMQASVVQTLNGGESFTVYIRRHQAPSIRPGEMNKLAILAIHQDHWFYINNYLIGQCTIPRLSRSRLDVGVVADSEQPVVCHFRDFRVYVPATPQRDAELE